jgi:hypothetical protein
MQVTFQNASADEIFVSALYTQLAAGASVTASRTPTQLDDQGLKALLEAGTLTVTGTVLEDGDTVNVANLDPNLYMFLPVHTDGTRPLPTAVQPGTIIWNSGDGYTNVSDGTDWYDPTGAVT